jgi:hypothetical protein
MEQHPAVIEALKYFPELRLEYRYKIRSKSGHGERLVSVGDLCNIIATEKLKIVVAWLHTQRNIKNFRKATSTASVYFNVGNKEFRVSDHSKKSFVGVSITVGYKSDPIEIIQQIIYHSWTI